ncbi:MAG TPA: ABC transporter ATP-binding protein [Phycisphaerae bacterium]|nr:ABC transporter ATP-binding protein [Phycisphaerae bacterium]HRY66392.1 ABC transporter ATP-binding protein [Phycisphaerae bacterium]HSA25901.1 ABC transporter ATP-binding protein [Phycisphaerae bacterium]
MSQPAIIVEGLSKQYKLGARKRRDRRLNTVLANAVRYPFRRLRAKGRPPAEDRRFWALKEVSFQVQPGEVLGIIGPNGAGKSTLLKILSRITDPTGGRARVHGRLASLLEVGTGFHRELTGRENVYLNGAMLGMRKAEIDARFDEIVAFSEVEKFVDTPVKHYSSGMYVRLAFAVAAHLATEILLVDEVLAVGDVAFQNKCLGKMDTVARQGRTILLVSHNMDVMARQCTSCLWLRNGEVAGMGKPSAVIQQYLTTISRGHSEWKCSDRDLDPAKLVQITGVRLIGRDGSCTPTVPFGPPLAVEIDSIVRRPVYGATFNLTLKNAMDVAVFVSAEQDCPGSVPLVRQPGRCRTLCHLPGDVWKPGYYDIAVGVHQESSRVLDRVEDAIRFEVSPVNSPGADGRRGVISPALQWESHGLDAARQGAA